MLDHATLDPPHPAGLESLLTSRGLELRFHRPPRDSGYGAARKAAFEYTLLKHLDFAIVMRGDSSHPPERLPDLIHAALLDPPHLLIVSRRQPARTGSLRGLAHRFSTFFQNRSLGLRLNDYHASFRLYPAEALARIPFQLDSDETTFDSEIILQFRALGVPIREEPLLDARRGDGGGSDHVGHSLASCMTAIGYRLHQIHATRDGRYIVDHDVHYTLKLSDSGSHMQIVSAIRPDSRVLDLGCSQGLLARPLQEKNARVTGVDSGPGERFARELHEYYQRDLEKPLEIPVDRIFDYVVCADVIEHLQNRTQLLRSARRYLKQDGRLIISTPNIALWFYRLSLLVGRFEYGPRGVLDETHVHLFTGATLRRGVEKAGFQIVGQRVTALPFEVVFESTGRSRLVQHLAAAYHWLARLWPSMFAYQYILEAEITTLDEESTELRQPHATDVP
jgi:2-polyprenyl-3-methyl-5-hydroxy-6-metoxy-1,4-benzoquinol methylase